MPYLVRLKDHVAIRENYRLTELFDIIHRVEGIRKEPVGKGILEQEMRDGEQVGIAGILCPVALQGAEIIGIAELGAELLEECPVSLLPLMADLFLQMVLKVSGDTVVIEQSVINIEKKNDLLAHENSSES